jgi:hypothetical protein
MSIISIRTVLRAATAIASVSFAFSILTSASPANAAIRTVGSSATYKTIQAAVNAASSGDIINVQSGTYGCANISKSGLTIQGVGTTQPVISGGVCSSKGLFVVSGSNTTVSNLSFKNATDADGNGAGIRMQGTNLTVLNSKFTNNQDGILSDYNVNSAVTVKNSTFDHNGTCAGSGGCAHAIYAGHVGTLDVENSTFTNTQAGHAIKSRANNTVVMNNNIQDGTSGTSAYLIDVPNGGKVTITGNTLEKGPNSTNSTTAIAMGEEGATNPAGAMLIANNTFQNDLRKTQEFIWNKTGNSNLTVSGNVLKGYTTKLLNGPGTITTAVPRQFAPAQVSANASPFSANAAAANFATTSASFSEGNATPVPEPGSLTIFGTIVLALGFLLRRQKGSEK